MDVGEETKTYVCSSFSQGARRRNARRRMPEGGETNQNKRSACPSHPARTICPLRGKIKGVAAPTQNH